MKQQQLCEPQSGKLVDHLPRDITFAYVLYLGHSGDHYKGINME